MTTPPSEEKQKHEHSHPGGAGAALGAHLARFSSMQGLSLLITNILHYGSIAVVARLLGPKPLGAYALLFFLTSLVSQLIGLASRPGTMMRTFGVADDDTDDVEDDDDKESVEEASRRPTYTLCVALIWKSFDLSFSFGELKEILKRGKVRIPIASSMWIVQNADSFILSRFLDHKSIGLYNLASRTGFMVAFLPQGFRIALRPVRKTAAYEAYRQEYGLAIANGQLLAYFYLITLT